MSLYLSSEKAISAVSAFIDTLRSKLVYSLPPYVANPGAKIIRLTHLWREVLMHRLVDLASAAVFLFDEQRLVPGCTITRSFYETLSHFYYLYNKIRQAQEPRDLWELREFLGRGALGSRDGTTEHEALQVLSSIDHLSKEFTFFRKEYEHLCEYAHPNFKGCQAVYAEVSLIDYKVIFGINPNNLSMETFGLGSLELGLMIAIDLIDRHFEAEILFRQTVDKHAVTVFSD